MQTRHSANPIFGSNCVCTEMRVNYVSGLHGPAQVARVLSGLEAENFDDFIIEENKLSLLFYFIFSSSFFLSYVIFR